ncbi:MAG: hypothetical protein IJ367_01430 [Clostridia bacterium]|nr:hypothetical protein [Clostridia bacterium]
MAVKSYEVIVEVDGKVDRIVVEAETSAKAKKQVKEMYPSQKVELLLVKQVV